MMRVMDREEDARPLARAGSPAARASFLGGGVLSARRTPTSDLDTVIVVDGTQPPYRESLIWRTWPVELFVQHASTIGDWFAKDRARRRPTLARMCADGVILTDADGTATVVRDQARAVLAAGSPPLERSELDRRRYGLTDLLDDLAGSSDPGETALICWYVLRETAELALLIRGNWLGSGKWLLRELRAAEPALAEEVIERARAILVRLRREPGMMGSQASTARTAAESSAGTTPAHKRRPAAT